MQAYQIIVKGRVQGVGYRYYIKQTAERLGIKGYVKNLKSGDVMVVVEAKKDVLKDFLDYCKIGSSMSNVKSVNFQEVPFFGYNFFEIQI